MMDVRNSIALKSAIFSLIVCIGPNAMGQTPNKTPPPAIGGAATTLTYVSDVEENGSLKTFYHRVDNSSDRYLVFRWKAADFVNGNAGLRIKPGAFLRSQFDYPGNYGIDKNAQIEFGNKLENHQNASTYVVQIDKPNDNPPPLSCNVEVGNEEFPDDRRGITLVSVLDERDIRVFVQSTTERPQKFRLAALNRFSEAIATKDSWEQDEKFEAFIAPPKRYEYGPHQLSDQIGTRKLDVSDAKYHSFTISRFSNAVPTLTRIELVDEETGDVIAASKVCLYLPQSPR